MKRKRSQHFSLRIKKKLKADGDKIRAGASDLPDAGVIKSYYPRVESLRAYLSAQLSKRRGRALVDLISANESSLSRLLERTLVGSFDTTRSTGHECGAQLDELRLFSQKRSVSTSGSTSSSQQTPIENIVDYCIWLLFKKYGRTNAPPHILCHGYSRSASAGNGGLELSATSEIPGLVCQSPNHYVEKLKTKPWTDLPALLGAKSQKILMSLILDCGIFDPMQPSERNWVQISGHPLTELPQLTISSKSEVSKPMDPTIVKAVQKHLSADRRPNAIRFVHHRILYGKAVLNASGKATFGQRPVHVLNRYRDPKDDQETAHVMQYMFPRQFGLHNVFTSTTTKADSAHAFLDYTIREPEIERQQFKDIAKRGRPRDPNTSFETKIPKRLRGAPFDLVKAIRKRHQTCSYSQLINHYCPAPSTISSANILSLATPIAQVSALIRSVFLHLLPTSFFGHPQNKQHILLFIHRFLSLRRYETLSLHLLLSPLRLGSIPWLCPPSQCPSQRLSLPETQKRKEILAEMLYWVIDSFLIPLLSSCFYITESSVSRNELLFFRHDVWLALSTPALEKLKMDLFVPLGPGEMKKLKGRQGLGESKIRLLPKETGLRPIINLRRRTMVRGRDGRMVLGRSINSGLKSAFAVLNCERVRDRGRLGGSIFSAEEVGPRLMGFKEGLKRRGMEGERLWFVKVDVKGCFDSIPQRKLMGLLREVVGRREYSVGRYAEGRELKSKATGVEGRVAWKFKTDAVGVGEEGTLSQMIAEMGGDRESRVFVDKVVKTYETSWKVLEVLREHVEKNVVRIGRDVYRQKVGIPQGSVVSSLLCSFFYGDMDKQELGFLKGDECLLMRLIDDFLLVTTEEHLAKRFVKVMHEGMKEYGVTIKHEKSLVNFDIKIDGKQVKRTPAIAEFPYCGLTISTANLNISADSSRRQGQDMRAAVTIEYSKSQGQSFYRKALDTAKLHMQSVLMSTSFNDMTRVQQNLYQAFKDMGWRCVHYIGSMNASRQPGPQLLIRTVEDLIDFAYALVKRKRRVKGRDLDWHCSTSRQETQRLAYRALLGVFQRRQTKLHVVVEWIRMRLSQMEDGNKKVKGG